MSKKVPEKENLKAQTTPDAEAPSGAVMERPDTGGMIPFLSQAENIQLLKEQLGRITKIDFPRVNLPSGKSPGLFDTTPLTGQANSFAEKLKVIILYEGPRAAYFEKSFGETGGKNFPDCYSNDRVHGQSENGKLQSKTGLCKGCPQSAFGSALDDKGNATGGKACRDSIFCFFLTSPTDIIPGLIRVPVKSLQSMEKYVIHVSARRRELWAQWTEISMVKKQNQKQLDYYELVFAQKEALDNADLRTVYDTYRLLLSQMEIEAVQVSDVETHESAYKGDVDRF